MQFTVMKIVGMIHLSLFNLVWFSLASLQENGIMEMGMAIVFDYVVEALKSRVPCPLLLLPPITIVL